MDAANAIHIHVDLRALQGNFFRRLQHQLDVLRLLEAAVGAVEDEQVQVLSGFLAFAPAYGAELPFDEARRRARLSIQANLLRESIEACGLFLDECLSACAAIRLAAAGNASAEALACVLRDAPRKHGKLHFPVKIQTLEREYQVSSPWQTHALSLNRLRTCIVHRLGIVGDADVDAANTLTATWRTTRLFAKGVDTGLEVELDRPGIKLAEDSEVMMQFVEHSHAFKIGETIELSAHELYSTVVTLHSLGQSYVGAIEDFASGLGQHAKAAAA